MPMQPFTDRHDAGQQLAGLLRHHAGRADALVLALPRGGVPVAAEIARALGLPLDLLVVRKLGFPQNEEVAMGAIATGGVRIMNGDLAGLLPAPAQIEVVAAREQAELARRERAYRGDRPPLALGGCTVLLVDDGLATGATMRAAAVASRRLGAAWVVVAVPVGEPGACDALRDEADEVVCVHMPYPFWGVGAWYRDFGEVGDAQVRRELADAPAP